MAVNNLLARDDEGDEDLDDDYVGGITQSRRILCLSELSVFSSGSYLLTRCQSSQRTSRNHFGIRILR